MRTRLASIDALRGFDMLWIIGGEQVAKALEPLGGGPVVAARFDAGGELLAVALAPLPAPPVKTTDGTEV